VKNTMKTAENSMFATYEPQRYKTFQGALEAFFEQECPQLGGARTRMTLVNAVFQMVQRFFPDSTHMKQGQIIWTTVHKDEKGSYGKTIKNSRLTPVVLDLIPPSDISDRANGKKLRDMKKDAAARICRQAFEQDGCMTLAEVSVLLKMAPSTASKYIREYEKEEQLVVPRRGTIHDMGPTLTHKKMIVEKLFIEQKSVQEVMRETCHSPKAIERYITTFRQILLCYNKGMSLKEICYSVRKTPALVDQYLWLIEKYKKSGYILERLENLEIKIESFIERQRQDS